MIRETAKLCTKRNKQSEKITRGTDQTRTDTVGEYVLCICDGSGEEYIGLVICLSTPEEALG